MNFKLSVVTLIFILSHWTQAQINFLPVEEHETKVKTNFMEVADLDFDGEDDIVLGSEFGFITIINSSTGYLPKNIPIGGNASEKGIAIADFDKNGFLDIAVTDLEANKVSILYGVDDIYTYQEPVNVGVGSNPVDIFAIDYDEDNDTDIIVVNKGGNDVSILKNNGQGNFSNSLTIDVGIDPKTVIVEKLNGDTYYDLVVTNESSNSVSIAYGTGLGAFSSSESIFVESSPSEMNVADIDDDDYLDLVVSHDNSNYITVLYGRQEGGFDEETIYSEVKTNDGLFAISDINDDNRLDIVINASFEENFGRSTLLFENLGSREFANSSTDVGLGRMKDVVSVDNIKDGGFDFIVSSFLYSTLYAPVKFNNSEIYNSYFEIHSAPSPEMISTADLNGDNFLDIVSINHSSDFITIYYYEEEGYSGELLNISTKNDFTSSLTQVNAIDIDKDNYPDIVLSGAVGVLIFYGNEDYRYEDYKLLYDSFKSREVVIEDINSDGNLDIISKTSVHLGDGNRDFDLDYSLIDANRADDLEVLDINNDGEMDCVLPNMNDNNIEIYLGNGGSFSSPVKLYVEKPVKITSGYFNDDNIEDVAILSWEIDDNFFITDGHLQFIYGNELSEFVVENRIESAGSSNLLEAGDLNNDGLDELIITGGGGLEIYFGDSNGSFELTQNLFLEGQRPEGLNINDVDQNGYNDIVFSDRVTNGSRDVVGVFKVDGNAPIINPGQSFSVNEDEGGLVKLGQVTVSNVSNRETLSNWEIISGNLGEIFSIDSKGVLNLEKPEELEVETTRVYKLGIRVSDGETYSKREFIEVNVLNVLGYDTSDQTFIIYPNPISTKARIKGINELNSIRLFSLVDTEGRIVINKRCINKDLVLDFTGIESGNYIMFLHGLTFDKKVKINIK